MADSLEWNNQSDVSNQSVTSAHPIRYPREASYFAAACAILFVIVGILGTKKTEGRKKKSSPAGFLSLFLCSMRETGNILSGYEQLYLIQFVCVVHR